MLSFEAISSCHTSLEQRHELLLRRLPKSFYQPWNGKSKRRLVRASVVAQTVAGIDQAEQSITGADLGVSIVVAGWILGLAMPFAAVLSLRHGRKGLRPAAAYLLLQALAMIPRDSPLMEPFRYLYRGCFSSHFNDSAWLTPSQLLSNSAKRQTVICGPHGLFSLALMEMMPARGSNMVMFADNFLVNANPLIPIFGKMNGMLGMSGLVHGTVTKTMRQYEVDVLVIAGGFQEAAVGTTTKNRVCTHMWPYWVKQSLVYGYDLLFLWVYGGTQVFNQSEEGMEGRYSLAKRSIPAITPLGKFGLPIPQAPPLRAVNVKISLPQIDNPTKEDVQHWVGELHRSAAALFETHPPPAAAGGFEFAAVEPMGGWAHLPSRL
jgi:hypothetical protein